MTFNLTDGVVFQKSDENIMLQSYLTEMTLLGNDIETKYLEESTEDTMSFIFKKQKHNRGIFIYEDDSIYSKGIREIFLKVIDLEVQLATRNSASSRRMRKRRRNDFRNAVFRHQAQLHSCCQFKFSHAGHMQ